jgi:hypothetical protein
MAVDAQAPGYSCVDRALGLRWRRPSEQDCCALNQPPARYAAEARSLQRIQEVFFERLAVFIAKRC